MAHSEVDCAECSGHGYFSTGRDWPFDTEHCRTCAGTGYADVNKAGIAIVERRLFGANNTADEFRAAPYHGRPL